MYWARKFKLSDCKSCNYIGIHKNDKRHAEKYTCPDGTIRPSRILNRKDDVLANKLLNSTSDVNKIVMETIVITIGGYNIYIDQMHNQIIMKNIIILTMII